VRGDDEGLVRGIGRLGLTAGVVNVVVGGGIFVLPAAVARELGSAGVLAYLVCGVAMVLVTVSFAIAGSRVSRTGGAYVYVETAFGSFVGYLAGVLAWLSGALASAGLVAALAEIASASHPSLQTSVGQVALVGIIYAGPVALNLLAITAGTRLVVVATVVKLAALFLFLLLSAHAVESSNLRWVAPVDLTHLGRASILAFFSLAGMEAAIGASGEIREPERSVPFALLTGMLLVIGLYVAIHLAAQGVLGGRLPASKAPLADAVGLVWPAGRMLMLGGMAFSMLGLVAGNLLGSSRILFAFGRDGVLPGVVASLHARTRIPSIAVLLQASIVFVLAITRTFTKLAILASVTNAILYGMACGAALKLARRAGKGEGVPLPLPAQRLLAALGVLAMLWLAAQSTRSEFGAVAATLIAAAVLFLLTRRRRTALPTDG
jgi:APA family basic amino acid/polyamine antiporter